MSNRRNEDMEGLEKPTTLYSKVRISFVTVFKSMTSELFNHILHEMEETAPYFGFWKAHFQRIDYRHFKVDRDTCRTKVWPNAADHSEKLCIGHFQLVRQKSVQYRE